MPRLIVTAKAVEGLERCRTFLAERDRKAMAAASAVIAERLTSLETTPDIGRSFRLDARLRELVIPFGASGYVALYRHEVATDSVIVLAFRHQREAGY